MKEDSLGIVMGRVLACTQVQGTRKLHEVELDIGDRTVTVATALPAFYEPDHLMDKLLPVKIDVKPATLHGVNSTARLIAIKNTDGTPTLLSVASEVDPGAVVM